MKTIKRIIINMRISFKSVPVRIIKCAMCRKMVFVNTYTKRSLKSEKHAPLIFCKKCEVKINKIPEILDREKKLKEA